MVELLQAELANLRGMQRGRLRGMDFSRTVKSLATSCSTLQSEIRKTGDDADAAVDKLPPEQQLKLVLRLARDLTPEHRIALLVYLEELGSKLL
jgi:hypothetical protein